VLVNHEGFRDKKNFTIRTLCARLVLQTNGDTERRDMEMAQVQAHQGYIETDGRLVLNDVRIRLPKNIKVTVLWDEPPMVKTNTQENLSSKQLAAQNFLKGVEKITTNELSEETQKAFESLERGEFKFKFEERLS